MGYQLWKDVALALCVTGIEFDVGLSSVDEPGSGQYVQDDHHAKPSLND